MDFDTYLATFSFLEEVPRLDQVLRLQSLLALIFGCGPFVVVIISVFATAFFLSDSF